MILLAGIGPVLAYLAVQICLYNRRLERVCERSRKYSERGIKTFVVLGGMRPSLHRGCADKLRELTFAGASTRMGRQPVLLYRRKTLREWMDDLDREHAPDAE